MRKKCFSKIMSVVLTAGLLAGCGSGAASQPENTAPAAEQKESETAAEGASDTAEQPAASEESAGDLSGKLVIWEHAASFETALQQVIQGFNAKYPNVEVEYEIKSGDQYYSLLSTSIQAGEAPDVFWTNGTATTQMGEYVAQDAVLDLTDKVDMKDLVPESLSIAEIEGKNYSVPWMTFDTRTCYYNKEMFTELGLEKPKTFDEFESMLQVIKDKGKIPISMSGMTSWPILFFIEPLCAAMEPEYTRQLDGYQAKASDERFGNAMNKMLEWADKGYFGDGWLGVDGDGMSLAFTTGEAAMCITGSWEIMPFQENNPDLKLGAFQIPSNEGTSGMVGTFANGFSIYKNTENEEAAVAFLNYCASLEAQTSWVQTLGAVSGSPAIESSNEVAKEVADNDETFISWQSNLSKYNKEGESATSIWEEDSVKVASKAITVQQLLDNLAEVMQ